MLAAAAGAELEGGLLVQALQHGEVDAGRGELLGAAERRERVEAGGAQQVPLAAGDAGDEAEVVVGDAALVAEGAPAADGAVGDRLGVGVAAGVAQLGEEAVADAAEVGGELGEAEGALLPRAEDDVDALRLGALRGGEQLAVEAELEDEVGLGAAGELGVGDLVAVGAEVGGTVDAEEEVGVAAQGAGGAVLGGPEEGRLVDHVGTGAQRLLGLRGSGLQRGARAVLGHLDPNDLAAPRPPAPPGTAARARPPSRRAAPPPPPDPADPQSPPAPEPGPASSGAHTPGSCSGRWRKRPIARQVPAYAPTIKVC